jgi:nucleoside-diphosphate kinase
MQRTLVLLKPDAIHRGLAGEIITRLERKGLKFVGMKMLHVSTELARRHYAAHVDKPFYPRLESFITSIPIVAMVVEGENAVEFVRALMGATNPLKAAPGTIRGDLAISIGPNLIHGSDSEEAARKEIALFFSEDEIFDYARDIDRWITES